MLDSRAFPAVYSTWPSSDTMPEETEKGGSWDEKTKKAFIDFLGASAWDESYEQTFGYRWRGQDTLTYGNPNEWVLINWVRKFFLGEPRMEAIASPNQLDLFFTVLKSSRLAKLEQSFTFRQPEQVIEFLGNNPNLITILLEAKPILEKFFGAGVDVTLEIVPDPEAPDYSQLYGYIHTGDLSPEEAFERLNAMDDAWFLKQINLTGGLFNFNLE